ncbi:MAG TPA: phage tail protein, partial [Acidimicrobiia bacterium]
MANRETFVSNSFQTTLSFDLPVGGTTVEVVSTIGSPGLPFYLVIDADNDALREIVFVDSFKDDDTFGLSSPDNRGIDGTLDVAHSVGALVGVYPVAGLWTDINDRVDATQASVTTHTHDGVSTAQVSLTDVAGHNADAHADFRTVGEVIWFAGTSVPAGFLECNGQAVSRTTYADLFSEIGTTWGVGDGSSTFNVPDLRDAVPVGASTTRPLGDEGGAETHAHGNPTSEIAGAHAHTQGDSGSAGSHAHSNPSTNSGGAHTHTNGSTGTAGAHGHSNPSTGSAGDHGHTNPSTSSVSNHSHSTGGPSSSTRVVPETVGGVLVASDSH